LPTISLSKTMTIMTKLLKTIIMTLRMSRCLKLMKKTSMWKNKVLIKTMFLILSKKILKTRKYNNLQWKSTKQAFPETSWNLMTLILSKKETRAR